MRSATPLLPRASISSAFESQLCRSRAAALATLRAHPRQRATSVVRNVLRLVARARRRARRGSENAKRPRPLGHACARSVLDRGRARYARKLRASSNVLQLNFQASSCSCPALQLDHHATPQATSHHSSWIWRPVSRRFSNPCTNLLCAAHVTDASDIFAQNRHQHRHQSASTVRWRVTEALRSTSWRLLQVAFVRGGRSSLVAFPAPLAGGLQTVVPKSCVFCGMKLSKSASSRCSGA